MTTKQSEEQPITPICPNCGDVFHHYHICQVGIKLPTTTTLSEERLSDLKKLYEDCQKSPPEISYGDQHAAPWIFFNAIYDAFPALLRAAEQMARYQWQPIERAPRDETVIWAFNGEQGRMKWSEGDGWGLWIWDDEVLMDVDPSPTQPTHWMALPPAPEKGGQGA